MPCNSSTLDCRLPCSYRALPTDLDDGTILTRRISRRILGPASAGAHSSSGLGHHPLKVEIAGSNPACATTPAPACQPTVRGLSLHPPQSRRWTYPLPALEAVCGGPIHRAHALVAPALVLVIPAQAAIQAHACPPSLRRKPQSRPSTPSPHGNLCVTRHSRASGKSTPPLQMLERGPGDGPKAHHTWRYPCGFGPSAGEDCPPQ